GDIDDQGADSDHLSIRTRNRSSKLHTDPGQEFAEPERFGDVVVSPRVEPDDDVDLVGSGRENDDRRAWRGASEVSADLQPVDVGQAEVEDNEVRSTGGGRGEGVMAACDPLDVVSVGGQ